LNSLKRALPACAARDWPQDDADEDGSEEQML
jgi:hypothetical protein